MCLSVLFVLVTCFCSRDEQANLGFVAGCSEILLLTTFVPTSSSVSAKHLVPLIHWVESWFASLTPRVKLYPSDTYVHILHISYILSSHLHVTRYYILIALSLGGSQHALA